MGNIASTLRKNGGCFGDCGKKRMDDSDDEDMITKEEKAPSLTSKQKNDILKKRLGIKEKKKGNNSYRDSLKEKQNFYKEKLSAIDSQNRSLFESLSASRISREKKKREFDKNREGFSESVKRSDNGVQIKPSKQLVVSEMVSPKNDNFKPKTIFDKFVIQEAEDDNNETLEFEVEGETKAPEKSKRFMDEKNEDRKTNKKIVKWSSRSTVTKSKPKLTQSAADDDQKPKLETSTLIENIPKEYSKELLLKENSIENLKEKLTVNKSQPFIRETQNTISKNKECFKSLNNLNIGENKVQWSLIENFMNPLRDPFVKKELNNKLKEDLDKLYDRYWYDPEVSEIFENLVQKVSQIEIKDKRVIQHIDFTYLRNCLTMNNYDEEITLQKITENLKKREAILSELNLEKLGFFDYLFVFGLDVENNCCLGLKMEIMERELKINKVEKDSENPLLSRTTSKSSLNNINFNEFFLYLHSLVELNFSKFQKELKLNNQLNFVIDFENCQFSTEILTFLLNLDNNSFPNFIKNIFIININLPDLLEDHEKRALLKTEPYKSKVGILMSDYQEALYKCVQQVTATLDYYGDLDEELFDLNSIVMDSLYVKYGTA